MPESSKKENEWHSYLPYYQKNQLWKIESH